jgi:Mor family transcriptional regulator
VGEGAQPEEWARAVAAFGGEMVDLPTGRYMYRLLKAEIIELAEKGSTHREIAIQVRCSERYVRRVLHDVDLPQRGPRVDARQTKLPFE